MTALDAPDRRRDRPPGRFWGAALGASIAALGCSPEREARPAAAAPAAPAIGPVDPLRRVNADFHAEYAAARLWEQTTLGTTRPYLFLGHGKLVLRFLGKTDERSLASARFDAVKEASHVPVTAVSAVLAQEGEKALRELAGRMREADAAITPALFGDALDAAHAVARASVELLEGATAKTPTEADLHAFGLRTRADTLKLLQAGCDVSLVDLDRAARALRPLTGDAWSQAVVVITTDHQSRAEEVGAQYFEHLFHERAKEGALGESRILVLEAIGPNDGATQAMASHVYDQHLSVLLFDEPEFLQGDVLGKHAEPTIARLLAAPF